MEPNIATGAAVGGYEFSAAANAVIEKAGGRARSWGAWSILIALLLLILAIYLGTRSLAGLVTAVLIAGFSVPAIVAGKFYIDAGASLRQVVETQGNDVPGAGSLLQRSWGGAVGEVLMGGLFVAVSSSFRGVANSAGDDVAQLMKALRMLSVALTVRIVLMILGGVVLAVALLA